MKRIIKAATNSDRISSYTLAQLNEALEYVEEHPDMHKADTLCDQLEDAISTCEEYYGEDMPRGALSGLLNMFMRFIITGDDPTYTFTEEPEEEKYIPYGGKLHVSSITNPFGESVGNDKLFSDGQEGEAILYWFQESQKYPTCTSIDGLPYQAEAVTMWAIKHEDQMREWAETYNCPYKIDYMLAQCRKPVSRSSFSNNYPDQISPFSLG